MLYVVCAVVFPTHNYIEPHLCSANQHKALMKL